MIYNFRKIVLLNIRHTAPKAIARLRVDRLQTRQYLLHIRTAGAGFVRAILDLFRYPLHTAIRVKSFSSTRHIGRIISISNLSIFRRGGIVPIAPWWDHVHQKGFENIVLMMPEGDLDCNHASLQYRTRLSAASKNKGKQGDLRVSVEASKLVSCTKKERPCSSARLFR